MYDKHSKNQIEEKPTLIYESSYGNETIQLQIATYNIEKRLYIGMLTKIEGTDIWEPFGDLTVNLPFESLNPNEAFIKDFCVKEKIKFIKKYKLGKVLPEKGHSGFCTYEKVAFDLKKLEKLDPEGMELFYKEHPELKGTNQHE